jgi:hypothetical protein
MLMLSLCMQWRRENTAALTCNLSVRCCLSGQLHRQSLCFPWKSPRSLICQVGSRMSLDILRRGECVSHSKNQTMLSPTPARSLAPLVTLQAWSTNTLKHACNRTAETWTFFLLHAGSVSRRGLQFDIHSYKISLLYSFPVFCISISWNHYWNLDTGFLFPVCCNVIHFLSFPSVMLLHELSYCQFVFFTCFSHVYFCSEVKHSVFLWRSWLQLNEKVKYLGL